ncbi:c-type cytochrome [Azospirillum halopraeferens]|uniref:c-type cytochrome n=1 Tax=Azospirillum halopraeferens TaxID=34010 RepID=UPI0003FFCB81|nr:cytochrome c family protein [Azospirillum halopraeferens]
MNKTLLIGTTLALGLGLASTGAMAGDAATGKEVFKECLACHTVEAGKNKVGPTLHGVVGRKAGAVDGFRYSKPMQEKASGGFTWTPENLTAYLLAPKEVVPGGTMAYAGLSKSPKWKSAPEEAAANLIAYMEEQSK